MLLDTIFAPFVKERPICVMARAVLERLLDAQRINDLFACTAQQQYTRELLFSSLVQLMSEVVLGVHPSVHAAYQANREAIGVSTTALYNKLDRVETGVSAALVRDAAELAEPVIKALGASHPRWVPGYQIKVLDGNHLASTEHRLKDLRGTWAAPLPGQALVVLDQQRMLITKVASRINLDPQRGWPCPGAQYDSRGCVSDQPYSSSSRPINCGSRIATSAPWVCSLACIGEGRRSWCASTASFKASCSITPSAPAPPVAARSMNN
jgi:hypothetical protein